MSEIKLTVELCEEDRKQLNFIYAAVGNLLELLTNSGMIRELSEKARAKLEEPAAAVASDPAPVKAPKAEEPKPAEEEKKPAVTHEAVQLLVQKLAVPGSKVRTQVRDLVKSYADRVSLIPDDKLEEVMERLTALQKGAENG